MIDHNYQLPPETTNLTVDCATADDRSSSEDDYGYVNFSHDGAVIFIKCTGVEGELALRPKGARTLAAALLAFANTVEHG